MPGSFCDFLIDALTLAFLPLVHLYHTTTSDLIFNVADENATGLEKISNELLIPYQFVFAGRSARLVDGIWYFEPRFVTDSSFWPKMVSSLPALPLSFVCGGTCRALSYLSPEMRKKREAMRKDLKETIRNVDYASFGIPIQEKEPLFFHSLLLERKKGDEFHLREEKKALLEVTRRLTEAKILWWVDCGTCLGAYRYGGVIPWDTDIDIAVLFPDFENVLRALSTLDPSEYIVEDWSSREIPKSYVKVFIRKTNTLIDLYHFDIHPEKREVQYILSLENHTFLPESWRIRERRFKVPTSFDVVFPLKRGMFDGVDVFIPNDPKTYLQLRYGDNLAPAKVFNPKTQEYEKDLSHPYWQRAYVH